MTTAPTTIQLNNHTLVQTAQTWPTDDDGWVTKRMFAQKACEGIANDIGTAQIYHPGGLILWPGELVPTMLPVQEIVGHYVRISQEDTGGDITDPDTGKKFTAIWWGKVLSRSWQPMNDQTGLDVVYDCVGLLGIFDQIMVNQHYESTTGSLAADITLPLVFNDKKKGNRSEFLFSLAGSASYVFDRTSGIKWSAFNALSYLIKLARAVNPGGPVWTLDVQSGALDFYERWDINGMSILEAITRIVNPRQSLGFRLEMGMDFQPVIKVVSLSRYALTLGSGYVLPASPDQTTLDLTDDSEIIDFSLAEDQSARYGRISIIGGDDVYIMTLAALVDGTGQFIPDWGPSLQSDWEFAEEEQRKQGTLAKVWLRWKIREDWNGANHDNSYYLPGKRSVSAFGDVNTTPHGESGFTGELEAGGTLVNGNNFELTRDIPLPTGYNWDEKNPSDSDVDETRRPTEICAFVRTGDAWQSLADLCEEQSIHIQTDQDEGAISIGLPQSKITEFLVPYLVAGGAIYFTVGVKHQYPLAVSWIGDSAEPTDKPRSITKLKPHASRKTITAGAIFRTEFTLAKSRITTVEALSELPDLLSLLGLSKAWYTQSEWKLEWQDIGIISTDLGKPGRVYTAVTYRFGDSTATQDLTAVVMRREWDFRDGSGNTKVLTKRIKHDIETVF